jgi:nucleotide-binding universal stress UspA family protein
MKILIALDDSEHSDRALDFVTRMRWPAGSRVIVVSALQTETALLAGAQVPHAPDVMLLEERRRRLEDVLAGAQETLRAAGFTTECRVLIGDPREVLVQEAQTERADLLVLGSHGRTGIAKLMLGSVSSHVVTHAPCSVMVVKKGCRTAGNRKESV